MIDLAGKSMIRKLEVRVGIEPTNKGFADLYPPKLDLQTVYKIGFLGREIAGFLPSGTPEAVAA